MNIIIKTDKEIQNIREAGKRLARVVVNVADRVKSGITTQELDEYAFDLISELGDEPAFLNYQPKGAKYPFPASSCISVNEEIVHGIPGDRVLQNGDIVCIDIGLKHNGVFADHAITVPVGEVSKELQDLIDTTRKALNVGINAIRAHGHVGDIGYAIENFVNGRYGIVRDLAGHGVGRYIHEDPFVPNYGKRGAGAELTPGMIIAIEPMLNIGTHKTKLLKDGYTIVTADGKHSVHFEHTVLITEKGAEILTIENPKS